MCAITVLVLNLTVSRCDYSCVSTVSQQTLASRALSRRLLVTRTAMKLRMVSHATIALDLSLAVSAPSLPAASRVLQVLAAHQAQVRVRMLAGTTVWLSQSHPEDGVRSVCPSVASKDGDGQHRHYAMAAASCHSHGRGRSTDRKMDV